MITLDQTKALVNLFEEIDQESTNELLANRLVMIVICSSTR
ncbi:hypothetical protein BTN50_0668 [Candidatus Enterovibrio altilux]|uniref:Uncharacterized protein n=1 Tax=Candidatus Enterovibrio altilux TaxID=1927128 RepID=A0A291B872_9GAMM|nr:hypothetical protein BTN50_0668 [Candidatus Enterovibrio luxaltus]